MLSKTLIKQKVRCQAPLRETLALSRASATSRSKTLALQGTFQHATRATATQPAAKSVHEAG
jgi:hypothetical protein